jgi:hypothetical protein
VKLHGGIAALALLVATPWKSAEAFCGFYVAGADSQLFADASQVVLVRDGTRTVLSMQNDYKGPIADFAMVVPVPVILQKENVKTLPKDIFARVDKLSAPRLVEYWERDPCEPDSIGLGNIGTLGRGGGQGFGSGHGRLGGAVTVEAQFEVGEYDIVILSAKDASALEQWLAENKYKIPAGSEPYFRPYVQAGSKFFVAKVNAAKVKMENGVATLSPLRFHYDSEKFELPVRLGLVNSSGTQDLIVHVLAPNKRYEVANYPNVVVPTNLDVAESARASFGEVYAALFDKTVAEHPKAVVTEYAWMATNCDPCPGGVAGLSQGDLYTLGADVLPSTSGAAAGKPTSIPRAGGTKVDGPLPPEVVQRIVRQNFGRFRLCHDNALAKTPNLAGNVVTKFTVQPNGDVGKVSTASATISDKEMVACVEKAFSNLSFPTEQKPTNVEWTTTFATGMSGGGGAVPPFVLTRLHARYGKDSLGADLVFKEAEPIVGGREMMGASGKLETGATKSSMNSFQARYAIRHPWAGKISCEKPVRNRWGGPWPDAGVAPSSGETIPATKLAYAPRGRIDVSAMFGKVSLAAAPIAEAATNADASAAKDVPPWGVDGGDGDGGPSAPPPGGKCGCRTPGGDAPTSMGAGAVIGLALAAAAFARRSRGVRASSDMLDER